MFADLDRTPQRAIIMAAGEGSRWNRYLGDDKHFAPVDGEILLDRTIRLLHENGVTDVWVVGRDGRYKRDGACLYVPKLNPEWGGADKFLSSRDLWLRAASRHEADAAAVEGREIGRTIQLYGDVYFSESAMQTIVGTAHKDWLMFARPYGSRITRCRWGECFAVSFFAEQALEHERTLMRAVELWQDGHIMEPSGWQHYRAMSGLPVPQWDSPLSYGDRLVVIDDWTEDFDTSGDYLRWMAAHTEPCTMCGSDPATVPAEATECVAALKERENPA